MSGGTNSGGGAANAARNKALGQAKVIQAEADAAMELARDAESLEDLVERTAQAYDALADEWTAAGDLVQAEHTRTQAMQARSFAQEINKLATLSAEDASALIARIRKALRAITATTGATPQH